MEATVNETLPMASQSASQASSSRSFRYEAVADDLIRRIVEGNYPVGRTLPTEAQLCASYGLSRFTIRQALDRLVQLGMIERRRGSGTTVVTAAPVGAYQPFASGRADIEALANATRLIEAETFDVVVDAHLARRIGARIGTKWNVLQGVRVPKEHPGEFLCWSEHYTSCALGKKTKWSFTAESIASIRVEQQVRAGPLEQHMAEALDAEPGEPALIVIRRTSDSSGRLINIGVYTHPGDRYEITTLIEPEV
jgi:DNA-binding GntR family transcriptional regulator